MSDEKTPPAAAEQISLELRRLDLEEKKAEQDFQIRKAEIDLKREEQRNRAYTSPLFLAAVAAFVGLMSNAIVAAINGVNDRNLEKTRGENQVKLQHDQAEASLILEAIKTGNTESAAANLELLAKTGLLSKAQDIKDYLSTRKQGEGPVLPPAPTAASNAGAAIPESLGAEVGRNLAMFRSGSGTAAVERLVSIAARGSLEKRAVIEGCLKGLRPVDDNYLTDLHILITLGGLGDGWCATDEQHKKVSTLLDGAHPSTTDETLKQAHKTALSGYSGVCK